MTESAYYKAKRPRRESDSAYSVLVKALKATRRRTIISQLLLVYTTLLSRNQRFPSVRGYFLNRLLTPREASSVNSQNLRPILKVSSGRYPEYRKDCFRVATCWCRAFTRAVLSGRCFNQFDRADCNHKAKDKIGQLENEKWQKPRYPSLECLACNGGSL